MIGGLIGDFLGQNGVSTNRIENSYSEMKIWSKGNAGGLVGIISDIFIDNSHATGDVYQQTTTSGDVGGLIGSSSGIYGGISNSYATGDVYSGSSNTSSFAGGLMGVSYANISSSYATGDVSSYGYATGGLVGYSKGDIDTSYATGKVFVTSSASPYNYAGGLVGRLDGSGISNSYYNYTGNLWLQGKTVGGLVGTIENSGTITNSYSAIKSLVGYTTKKGLVGNTAGAGAITNSYFDNTILSGMSDDATYGKSTTFLQTKANFTSAGWNISGLASGAYPTLTFGGTTIWEIDATLLTYTLSDITSGYIYKGSDYLLTDLWSTADLFDGTDYDTWTLGTDYTFSYSAGLVTGFTDAGTYNNISIDVLKGGYALAGTGNTIGNFVIDKKDLTISGLTAANKIYDGTTASNIVDTGLNLSGLVTGDTFTVASTGIFADKNVAGGISVTLTNTIGGADASNYNVTDQTSTTANITPKELTISGLTSANKVYDGTTSATVGGAEILQAGVAAGTGNSVDGKYYTGDTVSVIGTAIGTFNDKDVADATTVSFSGLSLTGAQEGNYVLADHATAAHTITELDVTANTITANNKIYDGTNTATLSTFTSSSFIGGDIVSFTSTNTFDDENTGTGKTVTVAAIALVGTDATNYNVTSTSETTIADITQVPSEPVSEPTNNNDEDINNIITPIVNNIVIPKLPSIEINTRASQNGEVKISSQPKVGKSTKVVTLTQLKNAKDKKEDDNNQDVVVPLGDNSIIALVNGGIRLPAGVDQQFYVVENDNQEN